METATLETVETVTETVETFTVDAPVATAADLIRGSRVPQNGVGWFTTADDGTIESACALGTAIIEAACRD